MKKNILIIFQSLFLLFSFHSSILSVNAADMPSLTNPMDNLQVPLPSGYMQKRGIDCDEKDSKGNIESCRVPYLADYIAGWFKYAVGIGALLGVITAMIGGFLWIISAGNAQKIGEAKKWITNGLIGIVLLATSYIILYQVNPELTKLKPITLSYVNEVVYDGIGCGDSCGKCEVPTTGNCSVDFIKANGGACFGPDIEKIAAICNVESGGNSNAKGVADYCKDSSGNLTSFSFGLFQINAVNSAKVIAECNGAFTGSVSKGSCYETTTNSKGIKYCKYYNCQPTTNASQCISALQNPVNNIKAACALYKSSGIKPWGAVTNKLCGFK